MVMLDIFKDHTKQEERIHILQEYFSSKNIHPITELTISFLNSLDIQKLKMLRQKLIETFKNSEKLFGSKLVYHPQTKLQTELFPLSSLVKEVVKKEKSVEEQIDFLVSIISVLKTFI